MTYHHTEAQRDALQKEMGRSRDKDSSTDYQRADADAAEPNNDRGRGSDRDADSAEQIEHDAKSAADELKAAKAEYDHAQRFGDDAQIDRASERLEAAHMVADAVEHRRDRLADQQNHQEQQGKPPGQEPAPEPPPAATADESWERFAHRQEQQAKAYGQEQRKAMEARHPDPLAALGRGIREQLGPRFREPAQDQKPDRRSHAERVGDANLARSALDTKGKMPTPAKIAKDIERGKASYKFDSQGERYLQYKDGKTYHQGLHGAGPRQVQLRQAATLGMTTKTATLVQRDVKFLGLKVGQKTEVLISRETTSQKMAGRDRDELRQRLHSKETGAAAKAWAKAQDGIYKTFNAEGFRKATTQEAIRAKLGAAHEAAQMREATRAALEGKANPTPTPTPTPTPAPAPAPAPSKGREMEM